MPVPLDYALQQVTLDVITGQAILGLLKIEIVDASVCGGGGSRLKV